MPHRLSYLVVPFYPAVLFIANTAYLSQRSSDAQDLRIDFRKIGTSDQTQQGTRQSDRPRPSSQFDVRRLVAASATCIVDFLGHVAQFAPSLLLVAGEPVSLGL